MEQRLAHFLLQQRWWLFALSCLLVLAAAAGLLALHFDADPARYFPQQNSRKQALEKLQQDFGSSSQVLMVINSDTTALFSREQLSLLQQLTDDAARLPFAGRVESLSNSQYSYSKGDTLHVENLLEQPAATLSDDNLLQIQQIALTDPAFARRLADATGKMAVISITANLPEQQRVKAELQLAAQAHALADHYQAQYPGLQILLSGSVIRNAAINNKVYDDATRLIPLMYLLIFTLLMLLLRSISYSLLTLLVTVCACAAAMGIAGWLNIVTNTLSITAINIIITVAIADCVHLLMVYQQQLRQGQPPVNALAESLRINAQPMLITSLTTAAGFLSMNLSDMPPAHDLGNITAIGVVIALLLTCTLLPALLLRCPPRPGREQRSQLVWLADAIGRHYRRILLGGLLTGLPLLMLAVSNDINDRFSETLKPNHPFRIQNDIIDHHFGGLYLLEYGLYAQAGNDVFTTDYLQALDTFTAWLRRQPEVRNVLSYADTIKRLNRNMHGDDPAFFILPETPQLAAQYQLLLEVAQSSDSTLEHLIRREHDATRLLVSLSALDSKQLLELEQRIDTFRRQHLPAYMQTPAASLALMWAHLSEPVLLSSMESALLALLTISVILILVFRSIRYGLISLIPNLLPAVIGYGIWALLNGMIDLSQTMVFSITIGIVVDDTIHFLSKYLRARRENGMTSIDAVRYSFQQVGPALWVTSLVLVAGFGLLALSGFTPNANLGLLTAMIIAAALLLDFLLLPALLLWLDKKNA